MQEIIFEFLIIILLFIILVVIFIFTSRRVNLLIKSKFLDGLKEYDFLLHNREDLLNNINNEIEEKKKSLEKIEREIEEKNKSIIPIIEGREEKNSLDFINNFDKEDNNINATYKQIKNSFSFDYCQIIRQFISENVMADNNASVLQNIKDKFTSEVVYKIYNFDSDVQKKIVFNLLSEEERKVLNYNFNVKTFNILKFVNYLECKISNENNVVEIVVGDKNLDYSNIDDRIVMVYDNSIIEGFKICYRNKIYDFSI